MEDVFVCDYVRTPIGRFGGKLSSVRTDDLGAVPIRALLERNSRVDWERVDDVYLGCANQAGEDNRNIARMSLLLAGLPETVPGTTLNRLCGSGMDAVITAARAIKCGEMHLAIAGGVESMSRAPFVMPKAEAAFSRSSAIHDTTIGWRFINPVMKEQYGIDSMPETAENVAEQFGVSREDQDAFALSSQQKAEHAHLSGRLAKEIVPVIIRRPKGGKETVLEDEHPRHGSTLAGLAKLRAPFREGGSVTAGNASGVNDGAAALLLANEQAVKEHHLEPLARVLGGTAVGIAPRIMGFAPAPAARKLLHRLKMKLEDFGVLEFNEAFASQILASLRALGIDDRDPRVNPNGGAIALGHPLGMSGARITGTAALELRLNSQRYSLSAMCIGVGQGIAIALEACR